LIDTIFFIRKSSKVSKKRKQYISFQNKVITVLFWSNRRKYCRFYSRK